MKLFPAILLSVFLFDFGIQGEISRFAIYPRYTRFLKTVPEEVKKSFYFRTACPSDSVALTFDDGPVNNTREIMDLLKEKNIPAAFFLVCGNLTVNNAERYKDPLFEAGMHSFAHGDYRKMKAPEIEKDVLLCMERFKKYGLPVNYFRPGYGVINTTLSTVLVKNNLKGILWSVDSFDWDKHKGDRLVRRVTDNLSPGSIFLFHDRVSPGDLRRIIDEIQKRNFKIVSLRTLLVSAPEYP